MNTLTHDKTVSHWTEGETSFALAIAVLRETVRRLPKQDQDDFYELLPALLGDNADEQASAQRAVSEILEHTPANVRQMDLPDELGPSLKKWTQFVSKRLLEARKRAKLTQEELAKKSGIPQSHISRLESGQHSPTAKTLEKLANALAVRVSHFDPPV